MYSHTCIWYRSRSGGGSSIIQRYLSNRNKNTAFSLLLVQGKAKCIPGMYVKSTESMIKRGVWPWRGKGWKSYRLTAVLLPRSEVTGLTFSLQGMAEYRSYLRGTNKYALKSFRRARCHDDGVLFSKVASSTVTAVRHASYTRPETRSWTTWTRTRENYYAGDSMRYTSVVFYSMKISGGTEHRPPRTKVIRRYVLLRLYWYFV